MLALVPIPVVIALVVWAGKRPLPPPPVLEGGGLTKRSGARAVELPAKLESGWAVQGKVERYDKKTLFDRIDGAAPAYIRAGFVYSLGAELRTPPMKDSVVADIYAMGSAAQALGMYATERDRSYKFIKVGEEGYLASGSLNLWRGQFYVKLAGFGEGDEMDSALTELGRALVEVLPGISRPDRAALAPLSWLPDQGRLPNSDGFSKPPLGDVEGLAGVFFASYESEDKTSFRLFTAPVSGEAEARRRYEQVKAYFAKDGARTSESTEGGVRLLVAQGDSTTTMLLHRGSAVAGGIDLPEPKLVELAKTRLLPTLDRGLAKPAEKAIKKAANP